MAIALPSREWNRIVEWTGTDRDKTSVVQRQEYLQQLKDASREMTKHWPNSLENVNKRNEETRRARAQAAEEANAKFYKKYLKRKQEEHQRMMSSARDVVFKDQDAPKMLLSAVIETVVLKEREEQIKFNKHLRELAEERKTREDLDIIRAAEQWHQQRTEMDKRRVAANKQHQQEILQQAREAAERSRKEYEEELHFQKIDNIKANQQMEAIKKFELEMKEAEKTRRWSAMESCRKEVMARKHEQATRDKLDDKLTAALTRARDRVVCRTRATEEKIRKEKLQVLERISEKLQTGDAEREAKENAICEKVNREKQASDEARRQAELEKEQRLKQERIEDRRRNLEDEEKRLHDFNTMKQWEIMNRFKNAELYEQYKQQQLEKKTEKKMEYKEFLLKQWKEVSDAQEAELAARRAWYGARAERARRADDRRVMQLARALHAEASTHHRPVRPITAAIRRYCKLQRIPLPELPEAAPAQQAEKRDGVTLPQLTRKIVKEESREFVVAGPANGLQGEK
ncbi:trichohyalin-like [Aricia agestis]|uniref:trichohyalin-like n=1 Tax=Aricia agestis TaxID=91739 RepID=UPI001C201D72|nr:trichohyalin-like [Aricia agestis]